jgi:predicted MFS family arabinose efflux permease
MGLLRADVRLSAWSALHRPDFRVYFVGSLISNLGTWLQTTAQVLLTYQLTHSVFAVGAVACAQFAGSLVLGPWAAVVASRIGGIRMLMVTQVISATIAGGMAALEATRHLTEGALVVGALCLGLAFTFALPVQTALVPRLVDEADTEAAMAMNSVSYNAGRALAPALCILVITVVGLTGAFAFNALSFVIFTVTLARVRLRNDNRPARPDRPARVLDGLSVALSRPRILLLLAMVAAVTLADDPVLILGPALARQLGASHDWAAYFLSALGLGTILGSFRPTRRETKPDPSRASRRAAWSLVALAGTVSLFAFGFSTRISLAAAFAAGVAALWTGAVTQTQLIRQWPERAASVMALWAIAWAGTKPLASLLDGTLANMWGVRLAGFLLTLPALGLGFAELCPWPKKWRERLKGWGQVRGDRLQHRLDRSRRAAERTGPFSHPSADDRKAGSVAPNEA